MGERNNIRLDQSYSKYLRFGKKMLVPVLLFSPYDSYVFVTVHETAVLLHFEYVKHIFCYILRTYAGMNRCVVILHEIMFRICAYCMYTYWRKRLQLITSHNSRALIATTRHHTRSLTVQQYIILCTHAHTHILPPACAIRVYNLEDFAWIVSVCSRLSPPLSSCTYIVGFNGEVTIRDDFSPSNPL